MYNTHRERARDFLSFLHVHVSLMVGTNKNHARSFMHRLLIAFECVLGRSQCSVFVGGHHISA